MTETEQDIQPEEDVALPAEEVEQLLTTIGKALRAFNMYQPNNPVFQRFRVAIREVFESLWSRTDDLTLAVTEKGFRYGDRVFSMGQAQARDDLPFAFYKDGIRSLTFLPGFEDEVAAFLNAINRALKREDDTDDLITVLWEEDFATLQYGYVDLLMEGLSVPEEPQTEPGALEGEFKLELRDEEGEASPGEETTTGARAPAKTGLSREDFDETLYFLDQSEMAALRREVEVEMERNLRVDVVRALFDRLEEPLPERQAQIMDILDQLLPLFLSRGDMRNAGLILEELDRLQDDEERLDDSLRDRIERLFQRLSDPEVLEQFVQAVEDGAVSPESDEVNLFFSRLHAQALPILIRFSEMTETESVQTRLGSAIDGLAARYPSEVKALLSADEPTVVAGAARVAGRVGLSQTVDELHGALRHPDRDVRMAVVEALVAIRLTPALQALTTALEDNDREVRIAAAKALGAVRFASARPALEQVIDGKRIKDADLTEKMAFFEAYGAVGGGTAVERLDGVLNGKGFLGRRSGTEMRACAALGLGQSGTPQAKAALERAKGDEDSVVRNAVIRALKEELVTK